MFFFSDKDIELNFRPRSIEHAYLAILNNDLESAAAVFESIDSPRARWGKVLVNILEGYVEFYPTYFEIRNFLEIDLDFLIKNEKTDYVEQLLGALEILSSVNQEVYKYAARVMNENNLYNIAKEYMEKSKRLFYNDPELHYMMAKLYDKENDYESAKFYIDECLKLLPSYYPAKKLKETLCKHLA